MRRVSYEHTLGWFAVSCAIVLFALILQPRSTNTMVHVDDSFVQSIGLGEQTGVFSFAGEEMPTHGEYFFTKEMLDREIAITLLNAPQVIMIHKRQSYYFPHIEKKLREAGIPDDFKYLAVAESSLRNTAVSTAGAAGIWQFMPETAKGRGLRVDDKIDERLHFEKATDAAISYIQMLYEKFGNWTLVAAAYNRGHNGLQSDMNSQQAYGYYDLWLNNETARYIFRIIAIKHILENKDYFFEPHVLGEQYTMPATRQVSAGEVKDLAVWAKQQGMNYATVRRLNEWITGRALPKGNWSVTVLGL